MAMLGGLRRLRVSWPQLPSLVAAVGTGGLPAAAPAAAFRTQGGGPARPPPHSAAEEGKQWVSVRSLASSTATRGPHAGSNSPTGGDGGGSKGTAAPAGGEKQNPPAVDVDHVGEGEEGEEEDDEYGAEEGVRMAFDQLITAAYDLLAQGKPMEAEYLLAEGAKQAEEVLGQDAVELAPLYDQLSIMLFLHEREQDAAHAAQRAMEILEKHDEPGGPASAIAGVRYASTLLGCGEAAEAQLVLAKSLASLEAAVDFMRRLEPESEEERHEAEEATEKFETGLGEALVYRTLARLALAKGAPQAVQQQEEELQQGLALMRQHLGAEHPLVGAALREHNRLVNTALDARQDAAAEALYQQEIRLHGAYDSDSEHQALLQYQLGTLQYVMGKYDDAQQSTEAALATLQAHVPAAGGQQQQAGPGEEGEEDEVEVEAQLLSVKQRLGVILGAAGQHEAARRLLLEIAPDLVEKAGPGNPLTHELNAILSLAALREAGAGAQAEGESDSGRREQLVREMEVNIWELGVYGEEHMLVHKARELFEDAVGRPPAGAPST